MVIKLKKINNKTLDATADVYQEIVYWLHFQIKKICAEKVNKDVLNYISESTNDGWATDNEIHLNFKNPGGMSERSQNAAEHWFFIVYNLLYDQLKEIVFEMGYEIEKPTLRLQTILEKTPHHPLVIIKGELYSIYKNTSIELVNDSGIADLALSAALIKKNENQINNQICECKLCNKLRKGKYKLLNLKELKAKEGIKTDYASFSSAIKNYRSAKKIYLFDSYLTEIPKEIKNLIYLESLTMYEKSLEEIPTEIKYLQKLKKLNLSNCINLKSIPKEIYDLNLESLEINGSNVEALPTGLSKLQNTLKTFVFNRNKWVDFITIPDEIYDLTNLEILKLKNSESIISKDIYNCKKLLNLELEYCKMWSANFDIGKFKNVENIVLSTLGLNEIVCSAPLNNLKRLSVFGNPITTEFLNKLDFSQFPNLEFLDLTETKITDFPKGIFLLKKLKRLVLNDTDLTELPNEISTLTNLEQISLYNSKLKTFPDTIKHLIS